MNDIDFLVASRDKNTIMTIQHEYNFDKLRW